jgi:hypothetical protein
VVHFATAPTSSDTSDRFRPFTPPAALG